MMRSGCWWTTCESDKRWEMNGYSDMVGGFVMPIECKQAIESKCKQLGVDKPPADLSWNYMKD